MLTNTSAGRRAAGRFLILTAIAVALPLTATRAIDYVDAPPAPTPPAAPLASLAPLAPPAPLAPLAAGLQALAPVAPTPPTPPAPPAPPRHLDHFNVDGDRVTINGTTKRWSELSPAEKQHIRGEIAKAKAELARTRVDRAEIEREVREALAEAKVDRTEMARELAEARVEIDRALREIDAHAADIRRSGQDPETIKAQVRASLKAVEAIDVEAITAQAMASADPARIAASVQSAEAAIARAQAEMDRLEQRLNDER